MASPNAPFGMKPIRMRNGAPYTGAATKYHKKSDLAEVIAVGDAVVKTGNVNTAQVKCGTSTYDVGTLADVQKATVGDGNPITGVVVGVETNPDRLNSVSGYSPSATEAVLLVADHPDIVFEIQANGALAATSVGLNAVLIDGTASTVTGNSGQMLDTTSDVPAADASNQLLITGLSKNINRNDVASYPVYEVIIVNHTESQANLSVGA